MAFKSLLTVILVTLERTVKRKKAIETNEECKHKGMMKKGKEKKKQKSNGMKRRQREGNRKTKVLKVSKMKWR